MHENAREAQIADKLACTSHTTRHAIKPFYTVIDTRQR